MAKRCFIIMGFGKKTDYGKKARTLDLDKTYDAIIEPAVKACGYECVRADKVKHSGSIDAVMYQMLLTADLVVADISTANPNALYELGVRHALRPFSTIIIKEAGAQFLFDLNHLATLQYKHLGEDIGYQEAEAKRTELRQLIGAVEARQNAQRVDSPVYQFLTGLKQPLLAEAELASAFDEVAQQSNTLGDEVAAARRAAAQSKPAVAREHFAKAYALQSGHSIDDQQAAESLSDPYIVQQLALATYKAEQPSKRAALEKAWTIIDELSPASSVDPETLGIAGAIHKRLWSETDDLRHLDQAVEFYGRGFEVKRDYYNGENYAVCLDWRADRQADAAEANYDRHTASKVRQRVVANLESALNDPGSRERSDYKWMLATMANTLFVLGRDGAPFEAQFRALQPAAWEIQTFEEGKLAAQRVRAR